jgi:hypothetical protein
MRSGLDLRVGHRADQVGDRCRQRPERRHDALAVLDRVGVGEGGHDDQPAVLFGGTNGSGGAGMTLTMVDSSSVASVTRMMTAGRRWSKPP